MASELFHFKALLNEKSVRIRRHFSGLSECIFGIRIHDHSHARVAPGRFDHKGRPDSVFHLVGDPEVVQLVAIHHDGLGNRNVVG
jgi:hypothetical protein